MRCLEGVTPAPATNVRQRPRERLSSDPPGPTAGPSSVPDIWCAAKIRPVDGVLNVEVPVGHAADTWAKMSQMLTAGDLSGLPSLYDQDATYLEPYNPPHRGNLLIQAYLKDWLVGKEKVVIEELKTVESEDGRFLAVEWSISYDAAGRRWSDMPRGSFFELDVDAGLIISHREYQ